jgi:hypothetical protein
MIAVDRIKDFATLAAQPQSQTFKLLSSYRWIVCVIAAGLLLEFCAVLSEVGLSFQLQNLSEKEKGTAPSDSPAQKNLFRSIHGIQRLQHSTEICVLCICIITLLSLCIFCMNVIRFTHHVPHRPTPLRSFSPHAALSPIHRSSIGMLPNSASLSIAVLSGRFCNAHSIVFHPYLTTQSGLLGSGSSALQLSDSPPSCCSSSTPYFYCNHKAPTAKYANCVHHAVMNAALDAAFIGG